MAMASSSSSSWVAIPTDRKRVIGELTRGREMADQLRAILRDDDSVLPAQGLVGKILDTFTHSLLLLTGGESDEVSQVPAVLNSPARKSEYSGDSCKKPALKDRRGCYKRRRTSETWTKESSTVFDDGHAWRKYGQKVILHASHPRNYFRCTHKHDQGCQATKQVQKVEDDPPLFRTTYHGHHTCSSTNLLNKTAHHFIMDADSNATIWSFQSHQPKQDHVYYNPAIKQEIKSSSSSQLSAGAGAGAGDGDYFISAAAAVVNDDDDDDELAKFDHHHQQQHQLGAFSSVSDVISSDVYSCTASTHSMDMNPMDMMVDSVFEDFLQFR